MLLPGPTASTAAITLASTRDDPQLSGMPERAGLLTGGTAGLDYDLSSCNSGDSNQRLILKSEQTRCCQLMCVEHSLVVEGARKAFGEGRTRPLAFRRQQLQQYRQMLQDHRLDFLKALAEDLNKPSLEALSMDVDLALKDANNLLANLDQWVKKEDVASVIPGDKSYIIKEPYGVVLVMGAWNYPIQVSLVPAAGAIAAGNTVVIKPSEVSPATAAAIAKYLPQYLDKECFRVVLGGVAETTELLKERFDYIFYTGSTSVGRIVREAANKYLTPTTLEMGGKSPCYVDATADIDMAARRILWGKMTNLGQTCIAPDYILCPKAVQDAFVAKAKEVLKEWYGQDPSKSPDLARIVAERHVDRLAQYLKEGKAVIGGQYNKAAKWVEPTVLVDVKEGSSVMRDEIFGPILPILNVDTPEEAITFINNRLEVTSKLEVQGLGSSGAVDALELSYRRCSCGCWGRGRRVIASLLHLPPLGLAVRCLRRHAAKLLRPGEQGEFRALGEEGRGHPRQGTAAFLPRG
ncbi:Fatty aldehyde dehydrogenase [Chionoecetes opilio]|uniref:Fatty aldehyde dehydrogenase n=1 Tax=Chionoecetes opilio TaxID=41210 RepID=A0A8J4YJ64_CHIOP|nr:Fatty aldehyde dehydrogenase [Chionoecetes opilio]